jgi:predicted DNA-binding transcriptional regulator AlpA
MQMTPDDDRLVLDVPQAGAKLGLGRSASYAAAKRGDIPTIKIGRLLRVPIKAFEEKLRIAIGQQES